MDRNKILSLLLLFSLILCPAVQSQPSIVPQDQRGVAIKGVVGASGLAFIDGYVVVLHERSRALYLYDRNIISRAKKHITSSSPVTWKKRIRLDTEELTAPAGFEALLLYTYPDGFRQLIFALEKEKTSFLCFTRPFRLRLNEMSRLTIEPEDRIGLQAGAYNKGVEALALINGEILCFSESRGRFSRVRPSFGKERIFLEGLRLKGVTMRLPAIAPITKTEYLAIHSEPNNLSFLTIQFANTPPKTQHLASKIPGGKDYFTKISLNFEGLIRVDKGYLLVNDNSWDTTQPTILRFLSFAEVGL